MDISWWCVSSYRPELLPEGFRELMAKRPEKNSDILHQITCAGLFDKGVFVECQETPLGKAGK